MDSSDDEIEVSGKNPVKLVEDENKNTGEEPTGNILPGSGDVNNAEEEAEIERLRQSLQDDLRWQDSKDRFMTNFSIAMLHAVSYSTSQRPFGCALNYYSRQQIHDTDEESLDFGERAMQEEDSETWVWEPCNRGIYVFRNGEDESDGWKKLSRAEVAKRNRENTQPCDCSVCKARRANRDKILANFYADEYGKGVPSKKKEEGTPKKRIAPDHIGPLHSKKTKLRE